MNSQPASTIKRFVNLLVDGAILAVVGFGGLFIALQVFLTTGSQNTTVFSFVQLLGSPLFLLYYFIFELVWQRTPGKWLTGTKVVMRDGTKPDAKHIIGRTFARIIPFESLSFIFKITGWHDSLSGTLVVPSEYSPEQVVAIDSKQPSSKKRILVGVIIIVVTIAVALAFSLFIFYYIPGVLSGNISSPQIRDADRLGDAQEIYTDLDNYYSQNNAYPSDLTFIQTLDPTFSPIAPTPPDGSCTAAQNQFTYQRIDANHFNLTFCLGGTTEDKNEPSGTVELAPGVHTITENGMDGGH